MIQSQVGDLAGLTGSVSEGKSGSFFFQSRDGMFFVKTISSAESASLEGMTAAYASHVQTRDQFIDSQK